MAKFNQKVAGGLIAAVKLGAPREAACASVGITSLSLRNWLAAANDGDERYVAFAEEFRREEANFERHLIASILKAGQSDWKAHAWILERKNKADWSMRPELSGADGEARDVHVHVHTKGEDE